MGPLPPCLLAVQQKLTGYFFALPAYLATQVDKDMWDQGRAEVGRVGQERHRGPRLCHGREEARVPRLNREVE